MMELLVGELCVVWRVFSFEGDRDMWLIIWWWLGNKERVALGCKYYSVSVGVSVSNANEIKESLCSKWVELKQLLVRYLVHVIIDYHS